jgi:bifunctional DNA-binding transcriptional regulator/antitoxin component of YhaV-PrlF toxin-antitoxin module
MQTKINSKGQLTIPWVIRWCLGSQPGDEYEIELKGPGRCELRKLTQHYPNIGKPGFLTVQGDGPPQPRSPPLPIGGSHFSV